VSFVISDGKESLSAWKDTIIFPHHSSSPLRFGHFVANTNDEQYCTKSFPAGASFWKSNTFTDTTTQKQHLTSASLQKVGLCKVVEKL
jgi:hypothetical protein